MSAGLDPIAYTYNAEHHCPECTERKFGRCYEGHIACGHTPTSSWIEVTDDEGNEPGAIAPWDEWHVCSEHLQDFPDYAAVLMCGTCEGTIETCPNCKELIEERARTERLTIDQIRKAQNEAHGMKFFMHAPGCTREVIEGKVVVSIKRWRPHGVLSTNATHDHWYKLPIRFGLMEFDVLTNENSNGWHMPSDCPLGDDPETMTIGDTQLALRE